MTPLNVPYDERSRLIFRLGDKHGFKNLASRIGVDEGDLRAWVFIDEPTMSQEAIEKLLTLTPEDVGPQDEG